MLAALLAIAAPTLAFASNDCSEVVETVDANGQSTTTVHDVPCRGSDAPGTFYRVRRTPAGNGDSWTTSWTGRYGTSGSYQSYTPPASGSSSSASGSGSSGGTGGPKTTRSTVVTKNSGAR
jgi:hypothetical protein